MKIQIELDGQPFNVSVEHFAYLSSSGLSDIGEAYVHSLFAEVESAKRFAAKALLTTYNENWTDDEHPRLSQEQFVNSLTPKTLIILDKPDYGILYFGDGDMFGGHSIAVTFCGSVPESVELEG